MKIALVDDSAQELDILKTITKEELPTANVTTFRSGEAFLENWSTHSFDLILLDIYMDQLTGIDVARKIRETDEDVRLVFCTTSNEFASESYEVGANYYLQKPISTVSFQRMLKMVRLDQYEANRFISLPSGQRIVLRTIVYTEYYNHLIIIHCKNGQSLQTRMSQMDWEALLSDYKQFYSSSKGVVVNFSEVIKQENSMFFMSDGSTVPISRRKSKEALDTFAKFRFEQMRKGDK